MNTQTKDERNKQQIRQAARVLFQKWGFQKTTMEDIAKATNKGKSTLYYYFKSKDDIFDEIATEEFDAITQKAHIAMERETSAEAKLRVYLLSTIEGTKQRATVYEIIFGEIYQLETIVSNLRRRLHDKELGVISKILTDGVRSGELRLLNEPDVHRLATIILLTFKTLMFEYAMKGEFDEVTEMIGLTINVFIGGLKR